MLAALCITNFVAPLSFLIVSPLLVDLARDFGVSIAEAGQLVAIAAVPAAVLSLVAGPLSDVLGRRRLLVAGTGLFGLASLVAAVAPTYQAMLGTRLLLGVAFATAGPATFAAVGDLFPYRERGRAYANLAAAFTVATVLGLPLATLMAGAWHWRWSFAAVGLLSVATIPLLLALYPAESPSDPSPTSRRGPTVDNLIPRGGRARRVVVAFSQGYAPVLRSGAARAILGSSFAMATGWIAFQTYLGAFIITRYGVGTADLSPILGIGGLGMIFGAQLGGRLGDRLGHKALMAGSVVAAAFFVALLTWTTTNLYAVTLLNFAISVPMGARFTSAGTMISEAVPTARATMNALNMTCFQCGAVVGAGLGGLLVEMAGYEALGTLMLAASIAAAALVSLFVQEQPSATT